MLLLLLLSAVFLSRILRRRLCSGRVLRPVCIVLHADGRSLGPNDCSAAGRLDRADHDAQHAIGHRLRCQPDCRHGAV
jgi:hypothetical protein